MIVCVCVFACVFIDICVCYMVEWVKELLSESELIHLCVALSLSAPSLCLSVSNLDINYYNCEFNSTRIGRLLSAIECVYAAYAFVCAVCMWVEETVCSLCSSFSNRKSHADESVINDFKWIVFDMAGNPDATRFFPALSLLLLLLS